MGSILKDKRILTFIVAAAAVLGVIIAGGYIKVAPSGEQEATTTGQVPAVVQPLTFQYIEVVDSCGPYFDGAPCVNLRSGPGTQYKVVIKLRNGMVLKVVGSIVSGGRTWYKIGFDGEVHYPERVTGDWYVAADYVRLFSDAGPSETAGKINASSTKRIVIDLAKEVLYAYNGDTLFMQQPISTGLELTPTPVGTFFVHRKMPDSYMQGPIPGLSDQYYDLPGVPWDLYFTQDGAAIHGAYWHDHFGQAWSHGCVNLPPDRAKILYEWADLGTPVIVRN
jgi:lipoprotein-anchoring transpeptidase ErfK/SrfK